VAARIPRLAGAPNTRPVSVAEALTKLAQSTVRVEPRGLIATRMLAVAKDPAFLAIAQAVPRSSDIKALAVAAAAAFAESGDFTALHVMTGTHAMRILTGSSPIPKPRCPRFGAPTPPHRSSPARRRRSRPISSRRSARKHRRLVRALSRGQRARRGARNQSHIHRMASRRSPARPLFRTAARRYIDQETYR